MNNKYTATVVYAAGQIDDEGQPVGTKEFDVTFTLEDDSQSPIEAIAETGNVQYDWTLVRFHD